MSSTFQPASNPSIVQSQPSRQPGRAHVLVIGNEKGGSGKSTTALHIAVALMGDGACVATLDLDARQGTLSRDQLRQIAETKLPDLNANDVDAAMHIIAGTARSMGVEVGA